MASSVHQARDLSLPIDVARVSQGSPLSCDTCGRRTDSGGWAWFKSTKAELDTFMFTDRGSRAYFWAPGGRLPAESVKLGARRNEPCRKHLTYLSIPPTDRNH